MTAELYHAWVPRGRSEGSSEYHALVADLTNPVAHPLPHPFLLVFAAAACLTGCGHDEPPPRAAVPVTVYEVDADPGRGEAVYSANVQPYTQVDLAFQ